MNFLKKKIKNHTIEVKNQIKVKETGEILELDTTLTIEFVDDEKISLEFDRGSMARGYIDREYKRTNIYKTNQSEMEFN